MIAKSEAECQTGNLFDVTNSESNPVNIDP